MANYNVYIAVWEPSVNPGAVFNTTFEIFSQRRIMNIRSIALDIQLYNLNVPGVLSFQQNTTQVMFLEIGSNNEKIGKAFNIVSGAPSNNGEKIFISEPKQLQFDSFYVSEKLVFHLKYTNLHAANIFKPKISVIVETNEKIVYQ